MLITKWWYALPVDGPDKLYWGFPFAFVGEGFHTSGSLQFFALEWAADFLIYFIFWLAIFFFMRILKPPLVIKKAAVRFLWSIAIFILMGQCLLIWISNPVFHFKRPYEWQVMETGYNFIWQQTPRPDIRKYYPAKAIENKGSINDLTD